MAQSILNYTTTVPASKTLAEIEKRLAEYGASEISKNYEDRQIVGVSFTISNRVVGTHRYILPANVDSVWCRLEKDFGEGLKATSREQATRTAFRILKDWIEAQLAIIEAGMATLEQVMMPYQQLSSGESFFARWLEYRGNVQLLPEKAGPAT